MTQDRVSEGGVAIPSVVTPLVRRHVEDAAFYWQQIDASPSSSRLGWTRLRHFDRMLEKNLEGAYRAGPVGMQFAGEALARWRQPGEVFVSAALALRQASDAALEAVLAVVRESPDSTARGLISALSRAAQDTRAAIMPDWLQASEPLLNMVALRALALGHPHAAALASDVRYCLEHDDAHVRAAACRAMACLEPVSSALAARLQDEDVAVRAEAAISLGGAGVDVLQACIALQAERCGELTGWYRMQSLRRLRRWVRHSAWLLPWPIETDAAWLARLPALVRLEYVAHRGDTRLEPWVLQAMAQTECPRYAGWAWQVLRGVDLEAEGLGLPESPWDPEEDAVTHVSDDDAGCPMPRVQAVLAWVDAQGPAWNGNRVFLGQAWSASMCLQVIEEGAQVYRAMAAQALRVSRHRPGFNVRAPAPEQDKVIQQLQTAGVHEPV